MIVLLSLCPGVSRLSLPVGVCPLLDHWTPQCVQTASVTVPLMQHTVAVAHMCAAVAKAGLCAEFTSRCTGSGSTL